ncbi:NAD-dependent succinate-semialdehyde dehydrogenase [Pontibacillus salipaludis]|uniref:NAD-dependent succinate-semialdehyde dehydrogenase n=1 Tax=Pontibacillus salipaludis TaxID=1697394 RepID=A0ABQ1PJQ4_9BACI|nr:NAD-dependent succinate-semialdehyde dehydrogenase [Pontibacillus salipaludis]GGC98476.1 NAD-dependent succinate-semialdehyde dehydrogenase [Pontibacillus salipaludis]
MIIWDDSLNSLFINGKWQSSISGRSESVINPATHEKLTEVAWAGRTEAESAIQSASSAFHSWSKKTARERSEILYRTHELLLERVDRLSTILTMEQGKPLAEAKGEIRSAANFFLWYAEEANRLYGEWIPSSIPGKRLLVKPEPIGVIAAITPWNFPSSMIARKLAPALASGCTVILKPAPETPLSAIELVSILAEAGVPDGVVNLVTGDALEIGSALMESRDVRLITFTGSTEVGKLLMKGSADTLKKLSLELGGHAPILVFEDANLERAASQTLASKFRNSGQTCICANRVYVHENVKERFIDLLQNKIRHLKAGNGLEKSVDLGPLINRQSLDKVQSHVEDAIQKGAKVLNGGAPLQVDLSGHFYSPTLLTKVTNDMKVMQEETFGPLLPLQTFIEEADVIHRANDTDYGLAAYLFTENLSRATRVSEALQYGIVGVNDVFPAVPEAPFGGIKQSGIGKEGGSLGIHEYVNIKYISTMIDE